MSWADKFVSICLKFNRFLVDDEKQKKKVS